MDFSNLNSFVLRMDKTLLIEFFAILSAKGLKDRVLAVLSAKGLKVGVSNIEVLEVFEYVGTVVKSHFQFPVKIRVV